MTLDHRTEWQWEVHYLGKTRICSGIIGGQGAVGWQVLWEGQTAMRGVAWRQGYMGDEQWMGHIVWWVHTWMGRMDAGNRTEWLVTSDDLWDYGMMSDSKEM